MFIKGVPLLDETERQAVLDLVSEDRSRWIEIRSGQFYSLGQPLYAAKEGVLGYRRIAQRTNAYMLERYHELQVAALAALSELYGESVGFHPRAAVPGFHIFEFNDGSGYGGGGIHFDLSHLHLPLMPFETLSASRDPIDYLSFCVAISLPTGGAGVNIWDRSYFDQPAGAYLPAPSELPLPQYVGYALGQMTIFPGVYLHQIAPVKEPLIGDRRITFQGHCVRINDRRVAFW